MEYLTLLASVVLRINLLVSSRFGEAARIVQDHLDSKDFYAFNPAFDPTPAVLPSIDQSGNGQPAVPKAAVSAADGADGGMDCCCGCSAGK